MIFVSLVVGVVLLVVGADVLVKGGAQLALAFRVPAIVVGLTIVAFGTSAPELSVSVAAALRASTEMALANVNGSNVANILLVIGAAALVRPMPVRRDLLRRDVSSLLMIQLAVPVLCLDGTLTRADGIVLFGMGVAYNVWLLVDSMRGRAPPSEDDDLGASKRWYVDLGLVVAGLAVLVFGAGIFVEGAVGVARLAGLSDRFIGLTVVAIGTSAPELATSLVSSYRGQSDLAVGNSVGSNILNIAMVLGLTAIITPIDGSNPAVRVDFASALLASFLLVPLVLRRGIGRGLGAFFVLLYFAYIAVGYLAE
jgi:cation:H+ antiporter